MILIGLAGPAGCGKDTAADYLCDRHGFISYSFAQPLKLMLAAMLDISYPELAEQYLTREKKEQPIAALGKSPRELLQTLGTEWGRMTIDTDLWLNIAQIRLGSMQDQFPHARGIVITDTRFCNEANWIRYCRGVVVHVDRKAVTPVRAHISERGPDRMASDAILDNNGTINSLYLRLDALVEELSQRGKPLFVADDQGDQECA